jgi:hypothetical protein
VLALMSRLARLMGEALPGLREPDDAVTGALPLWATPGGASGELDDAPFLALTEEEEPPEPPPAPRHDRLAAPLPAPPRPPGQVVERAAPPGPPPRRGDLAQASVPRLLVGTRGYYHQGSPARGR